MKRLDIPEPCHENWADFTPTEKGAFCGSCQIDVVDFSNKSPNEVKTILQAKAGKKMCGRFRKTQLDELNDDFFAWENQSQRSFQSKFLYACLIVFGMSLFTSCHVKDHFVMGKMLPPVENVQENNQLDLTDSIKGEVKVDPEEKPKPIQNNHQNEFKKGKIAYHPDSEEKPADCSPDESLFIKGDTIYIPEENKATEDSLEQSIAEDTLYDDIMIDGEIEIPQSFETYVNDTTDEKNSHSVIETVDSVHHKNNVDPTYSIEVEDKKVDVFQTQLYPNPGKDVTNVVLEVFKEEQFNIYLYAIDGKRVKQIFMGKLPVGEKRFVIDLINYPTGNYLIVIQSHSQKTTLKLEKIG
ncbi:MAG: T9SS type A sorting domain-containing protein [Crocinitomicaceae bacterium]